MTESKKFRKKPVEITASQWFENGDHPEDYASDIIDAVDDKIWTAEYQREHNWEGQVVRYFRFHDISADHECRHCGLTAHLHGWIDTLEGGHIVCPGDWIITDVAGERYPCKPSVFQQTYEAA